MRRLVGRGTAAGAAAGIVLVAAMVLGLVPAGLVLAAAVSERARGLLPLDVLAYLIVRLKFAAKPLGFWMSMIAVGTACAAAGGLAAALVRRPLAAAAALAVAVGVGLTAVAAAPAHVYLSASLGAHGVADPDTAARWSIALGVASGAVLAGLAYAAGLALLRRGGAPGPAREIAGAGGGVARREFLARSVGMGAALVGAGAAVAWVKAGIAAAAAAAASIFQRIQGLPPEVTPNGQFYVISKNPMGLDPRLDGRRWRLDIAGLVGRPLTLSLDDIKAMPALSRYHTLACISNEVGGDLIGNASWKGVRLRDVIGRAGGVNPRAIRFAFRSADGYTEGIPVADAMQADVMLAYEMNGAPLPPEHGFPLRLLIPGLFGMKNPKWITKIEAVSTDFTGYWQASGWSDEAVVQTMSAIRVPGDNGTVRAGEVGLGGVAYSGDRGIAGVEVSVDGGRTWMPAEVKPALGPYTWVLWAAIWKPAGPGRYTVRVRARDGGGVVQTAAERPTLPDGATGHHTIRVQVRG
jgi:DMSO/TMAO reductase YedYZ molybdopterin-dependent catalytic subunit